MKNIDKLYQNTILTLILLALIGLLVLGWYSEHKMDEVNEDYHESVYGTDELDSIFREIDSMNKIINQIK